MSIDKILVACSVFKDEVEQLLPEDERPDIIWLDASLHVNETLLEEELSRALEAVGDGADEVKVLFGHACHIDMPTILERFGIETARFANCIEAFCGDKKGELEQNGTMLMTPGWIRTWPDMMRKAGYDETDLRMHLGRYDRILVLDSGHDPLSDEEILEFFDLVQVPVEVRPLDLSNLRTCIHQVLNG